MYKDKYRTFKSVVIFLSHIIKKLVLYRLKWI